MTATGRQTPTRPATPGRLDPASVRRAVSPWVWVLVVVAGVVGATAAPEAWPPGEGRVEIVTADQLVAVPVTVGDTEVVTVSEDDVTVGLPAGVPLDDDVHVEVAGARAVEDVQVTLVLADGRAVAIPTVDLDGDTVVASRRPLGSARPVLALFGVVLVLWITELVPLWVTSLTIPVALSTTTPLDAEAALAPFFHPIIVLFLAGFLLAEAMRNVGLDRVVADRLVAVAGGGPVRLYLAFVAVAAALSMAMSNTAAVAVLLPVALAVTEPPVDVSYRRTVVLGTAYAATIGGVGSAIGTPANLLAITFLDDLAGRDITFLGWFVFGLPVLVVLLPVLAAYLWRRMRPTVDVEVFATMVERARAERAAPATPGRATVVTVFVLVVLGWVLEPLHGVHLGIVALAGAIVLAVVRRIRTADLARIPWSALITFGGGLTLGLALTTVGLTDEIAARLGGLAGLPTGVAVALTAATALALTTVASNTAAAAMLIPVAIPLAPVLGVDPVLLVIVVAVASSIDFALVIGTPPTMLAHSTGLFSARELLRVGGVLDAVALVLLVTVVTALWSLLGVVGA